MSLVAAGPPTLTYGLTDRGELQLAIAGHSLQQYAIEVSADLVNWSEFAKVTLQDGSARVSASMTVSRQFYRARLLP